LATLAPTPQPRSSKLREGPPARLGGGNLALWFAIIAAALLLVEQVARGRRAT
jgi:hypothetical protein